MDPLKAFVECDAAILFRTRLMTPLDNLFFFLTQQA